MKRTVSQILQAGRARLAAPGGWTKYRMSRLRPTGGYAYCAAGAVYCWDTRWPAGESEAVFRSLAALKRAVPDGRCIGDYNDDPCRTLADILALYDRALTEVTK